MGMAVWWARGAAHGSFPVWAELMWILSLSWSFPTAQYSDFRSWKGAAAVAGLAGVESCWAAWASSTWHCNISPSLPPLLGLFLNNPIKMMGLEEILWFFMAIYWYFPAAVNIYYIYLASCITSSSLTKLACSEGVFLFTSVFQFIFLFWVWWEVCVRTPGIFCFKFSFWVLISAYIFMLGICILSAQVGNWLSLIVCLRYLYRVFPVPVCTSKTDAPDKQFLISLSHLNGSEFFFFTDFAFVSMFLSGLHFLLIFLCICLMLSPFFGNQRKHPSLWNFFFCPFLLFINFLPFFLG